MSGLRVFLIEDNAPLAVPTKRLLESEGIVVVAILTTVAAALKSLDEASVDVAVLDTNLKGESAEPVVDKLRAKGVPFVIISGYARDQIGAWRGDAPIVKKPFTIEELAHEIRRCAAPPNPPHR